MIPLWCSILPDLYFNSQFLTVRLETAKQKPMLVRGNIVANFYDQDMASEAF